MTLKRFILPVTVAVALAGAVPADAQQRHGGGSHDRGGSQGRSVQRDARPRGSVQQHRVVPVRPSYRGGRVYRAPFVRTRIIHPFYRPFYAFRPHLSLGFGLFLGYPVAYPWDYVGLYPFDPYAYDGYGPYAPYGAPAPPSADPYATAPGTVPDDESRDVGGISLNISPSDATVTVDGSYAGIVGDFSPSSAPLTLVPGSHHVVVAKPGYRSMIFDATIAAGQVLPYQGRMQPQ